MAVQKVKVSQLPKVGDIQNFEVLGLDKATNQSAKADMTQLKGNTGDSAFDLWLKQPGNEGKTYDDYLAYNKKPAVDAAAAATATMVQISQDWSALEPQIEAAIDDAEDTAKHPSKVGEDYYVYEWNKATQTYNKTDIYLKGDAFKIEKVYPSIAAMNADVNNPDILEGDFVMVNTGSVEDPDTAKLYVKTKTGSTYSYQFIVDMSGAIGFTGKTPQLGVGTVGKTTPGGTPTVTLTDDGVDGSGNPKYKLNFVFPTGDTGPAPIIQNGTITTGEPGSAVNLTFTYVSTNAQGVPIYRADGSIPQGQPGTGSGNVFVTTTGLLASKTYLFKPGVDGSPNGTMVEYTGTADKLNYVTSAGTATAYTAALPGFVLVTGSVISVKMNIANTSAAPTLNVNGTGAKTIVGQTGGALVAGELELGGTYLYQYNGTQWVLMDSRNASMFGGYTPSAFKKYQTIVVGGTTDKFYPVTFLSKTKTADIAIHSRSSAGSDPFNQNVLRFTLSANGWGDMPKMLNVYESTRYQDETTIHSIWYGQQAGGNNAIYLRGGLTYYVESNLDLTVNLTKFTSGDESYDIMAADGTVVNTQVNKAWTAGDGSIINANASIASTAVKLATPRTIGLSGAVVGTPTAFDGSGDIAIPVTSVIANSTKFEGANTVTSPANTPIDLNVVNINLTANGSFSAAAGLLLGRSILYFFVNSTAAAITVALPTTGGYESNVASITIPANSRMEMVLTHRVQGLYSLRAQEA